MKKIKQQKYLKMKNKTKQKNYNINQKSFYFEDYLYIIIKKNNI